MDFNKKNLVVSALRSGKGYGLFYGNACLFSDKNVLTVNEQYERVAKYGVRCYRLIADFYAHKGNHPHYFRWLDLHDTMIKVINCGGDTLNNHNLTLDLIRQTKSKYITDEHVTFLAAYYPR